MPSKTAAYHTLLGLVYDQLPEDTVAQCVTAKISTNTVTLQNVRRGTTHKLPLLIQMVKVCLPSFPIPAEVLSA
jgi:hypothetical protein